MNFDVTAGDHQSIVGVSPLVVGESGSIFTNIPHGWPDSMVVDGSCPGLNDFDLLAATGVSTLQASYHGNGARGAVLMQKTPVAPETAAGFVLSGFSFDLIRDVSPGDDAAPDHLLKILDALGLKISTPVDRTSPRTYSLAQNYPNPFNPTTTIEYSIVRRGPVSLRVYNVAGQLVRTLVDEVQSPEQVAPVRWDGRNDAGYPVSSGVYFYRLTTPGFTQTRKMVILK